MQQPLLYECLKVFKYFNGIITQRFNISFDDPIEILNYDLDVGKRRLRFALSYLPTSRANIICTYTLKRFFSAVVIRRQKKIP